MDDLKLELIAFLESLGEGEMLESGDSQHVVTCHEPTAGRYYELHDEKWTRLDLLADRMLEHGAVWNYFIGEEDDTEDMVGKEAYNFYFGTDADDIDPADYGSPGPYDFPKM
jgi:hypothetical protein